MSTRALTPEDFRVEYDDTHTFEFFEDEDGNGVYAYGHKDEQAFATAVNYYDRLCFGEIEGYYGTCDVNHGYARAVAVDIYEQWALRFCKADDEFATPVTWVSR